MLILFIYFLFSRGAYSFKVTTTTTEINSNLGSNVYIVLNCTYELEINETIDTIYLQKAIESANYNKIVKFRADDGRLTKEGEYLQGRSKLNSFGNVSTSAVMTINDIRCEDGGQYQCLFEYFVNLTPDEKQSDIIVHIETDAEKPAIFSIHPNNSLKEHGLLDLSCSANVGTLQGLLAIWKRNETSNNLELLQNTSKVYDDIGNCKSIANLTVTYNLTRQDNGAMFRCSSQNKDTQKFVEIGPIDVLYGPSFTTIEDSGFVYFIGNVVKMKCISDGNPTPNYSWVFNFTAMRDSKYTFTLNNSTLTFTTNNITDSGYYQCVASNYINGKLYNNSYIVTLTVRENNEESQQEMDLKNPCLENPCLIIETCILRNGNASCLLNIWSVISFAFIILTLIFFTKCTSLLISRKKQQKIKSPKGTDTSRFSYTKEKFEDFGGYADPKDVQRPENAQIKSDKDGRDNPYADPVDFKTQYAVVQKSWATPAKSSNSSNPSNLVNDTDSSNTESPPETTNPKNLSSNEKTSGSTETSETIPKPPNVYGFIFSYIK